MAGKGTISDYRKKLDETLASPDLTNDETIHTLVKNQILQSSKNCHLEECSENVVGRRSKEMSNFLNMLRSASVNDIERSKSSEEPHTSWKIKQDTDEFRVMYREGPKGTPFHTLLVEGYVDGPVDLSRRDFFIFGTLAATCKMEANPKGEIVISIDAVLQLEQISRVFGLCISCESDLYQKWWPQTAIPTFKVVSSKCVQRVRMGEQISLVRMKVSWPLSSREALVHFFVFEYFEDGLVVVLLNSISDSETIDKSTHGFTRDGIPDAQDVVRMDVVGGFALQKVTAERSYFRTIANMDIKLDFVPPSFINFISRQLVGSGFKLYKKEVASVSKGDEKFLEALKDPLYTRIHKVLYSRNTTTTYSALENTRSTSIVLEEQSVEAFNDNSPEENKVCNDIVIRSEAKNVVVREVVNEIEEFKEKEPAELSLIGEITQEVEQTLATTDEITGSFIENKVVAISPEVKQALGTLEKVISVVRGYNGNYNTGKDSSDVVTGCLLTNGGEESISSEDGQITRNNGTFGVSSTKIESEVLTSQEPRHKGSNSYAKETNQSKIAPASPEEGLCPSQIKCIDLHVDQRTITTENYSPMIDADDDIQANSLTKRKNKKLKFCCLNPFLNS